MKLIKLIPRYHMQDIYINPEQISDLTTTNNKVTGDTEYWVTMMNGDSFSTAKNSYDELIKRYA